MITHLLASTDNVLVTSVCPSIIITINIFHQALGELRFLIKYLKSFTKLQKDWH